LQQKHNYSAVKLLKVGSIVLFLTLKDDSALHAATLMLAWFGVRKVMRPAIIDVETTVFAIAHEWFE